MIPTFKQNPGRYLILFILTGILVIVLGLVAVTGWLLDITSLKSVLPGYATMKFNTALCFIMSGTSFLLLIGHDSRLSKNLFRVITICLGLFAAISLSQSVFHWSAGIDQLFFSDYTSIKKGLPFPGRMADATSCCFSLLAISFLGISSESSSYKTKAQYLLHLVAILSFTCIVGFLLRVPYSLKFSFFSSMSIPTSVGIFLLSIAASAINYSLGITGLFTGTGPGNIIARKLFPGMAVILVLIGYISLELQRKNYISTEFGLVVSTIIFLLMALFLTWNTFTEMNQVDLKRTEAENELKLLNKTLESRVLQRTLELERSNERFTKIFNASPACIAITNLDTGKYAEINPALIKLLKYNPEEIIGHTAAELSIISAEYRQGMVDSIKTKGYIREEDIVIKSKNDEFKQCTISAELLETEEGRFMMSFVHDITERKTLADNLLDANKKLEVLADKLTNQNKQLLSFAHITSHNLRAPVANLKLLLYFYKESTIEKNKDELWDNFETVIGHLNTTLEDLIETLKIQEDTDKEREVLFFEKTFNSINEILVGQLRECDAIINTDFSRAPQVVYPKIYLESIMLNLVSNAIKYKSPKRVPEITIMSDCINDETTLTVKDNGLGIDLERHRANLFGMRKTFHRHAEAKGLGLYITKTQIDAMGGEISAESAVDVGTTFKVVFNKNQNAN